MFAKPGPFLLALSSLAISVTVLCSCTSGRELDDRGMFGLCGKVRRLSFVREDAANGLPPMFADAEGEVGFDTLGRIAYVNDMDFITCGDSIVIAASIGGRDEEAACRRWQDGDVVVYDGHVTTQPCDGEELGLFAAHAEFDDQGRLVDLTDKGLFGTLLGLWDWSAESERVYIYEGDRLFPAGEKVVATFGGSTVSEAAAYTYLATDSVGNWTLREARFAGSGKAAFIERRRLDYWE